MQMVELRDGKVDQAGALGTDPVAWKPEHRGYPAEFFCGLSS